MENISEHSSDINKEIAVVIPLLNEAEGINELYQRLINVLSTHYQKFEIIFVDDGSSDDSFKIITSIVQKDRNVIGLRLRKNFGKAAALSAGFDHTKANLIVTIDADLQDQPEEIPKLADTINQGYDLVCGWRYQRKDSFSKRLFSGIFNRVTSIISGLKIHDINCGLKIFRRQVLDEVKIYGELHRYLPVTSFFKGFKIGEVKVQHQRRRWGRSKYGANRIWRGPLDLITVVFLSRFSKRPLHFLGPLGLFLAIPGFLITLYLTSRSCFLFTAGILLIIVGVQFISLGLLAEMLNYMQPREKKEYSIAAKIGEI